MSQEYSNNYVLTNVLEVKKGDGKLFKQVEEMASKRGSLFVPVKLLISEEENMKRISNPERTLRYKSLKIDPNSQLINISHPNLLKVDVSDLSASSVAEKILDHILKL